VGAKARPLWATWSVVLMKVTNAVGGRSSADIVTRRRFCQVSAALGSGTYFAAEMNETLRVQTQDSRL